MTRGGYPEPSEYRLDIDIRRKILERISCLGEGAIFRNVDVAHTDEEMTAFSYMRNHDHIHLLDDLHTGIVETPYLRRLPARSRLMNAYQILRDCRISQTGDRLAWHLGIIQREPIKGVRYYSSGPDEILSFGHMKIRVLHASAALLDNSESGRLFRAFLDIPEKDRQEALRRRLGFSSISAKDIQNASAWAREQIFSPIVEDHNPGAVIDLLDTFVSKSGA